MNLKTVFSIIGIIALSALILFAIRTFSAPNNLNDNSIILPAKKPAQEVTLSFKNYNYYPQVIGLKKGIPAKITADSSVKGCYTYFVIPEFGIEHSFTQSRTLEFIPDKTGTFVFSCSMGMGTGKIIVK